MCGNFTMVNKKKGDIHLAYKVLVGFCFPKRKRKRIEYP